ncbi:MAG TPA: LysM peptidoglycan-binding domain-containing protein [Candidatus Methylomirabilis sp.]|nr:LysM peptidoglycan-binding domain-containing protein [Candidatus Methylomirabilis sp.]
MIRTYRCCLGCFGLVVLCLPLAVRAAEAPPAPASAPGETYVVKQGDTLWGIAKGLLNDPILWPRIWEQNPFITDPNRIFPGDTLAVPGREPAPPAPAPVAAPPAPEPPKEVPKVVQTEVTPPPPPAPPPQVPRVEIPPVPPASRHAIACSPILVPEAVAVSSGVGSILTSEDGRQLVGLEDRLTIGLDAGGHASVGDRLAVIRPGIRVIDPQTRRSLGRILYTLGVIEVQTVRNRTLEGRVIFGCEAVSPGDRVAPFVQAPFPEDKIARPTTRSVEGIVLESSTLAELLGQQHLIFVDVGERQGIDSGDIFAIYRPNIPAVSPATGQEFPIPPDRLGEAVVIRVTEGTATAVVTASSKEIQRGDRVVLSRRIQP